MTFEAYFRQATRTASLEPMEPALLLQYGASAQLLLERLGPFPLAYLESLLRVADGPASIHAILANLRDFFLELGRDLTSGADLNVRKLLKVRVQRGRFANAQLSDHDVAGAIGEAPARCCTLLEKQPRTVNLVWGQEVNAGDPTLEKLASRFQGTDEFASGDKQRQRFINAVVCRQHGFVLPTDPVPNSPVIGIGRNKEREPRTGIDKDHHGFPYSTLSWSAPLNGSCEPSIGSAAMRSIASSKRRCSSSAIRSSSPVRAAACANGASGHTMTGVPSGRPLSLSSTTIPFFTRPRATIGNLQSERISRDIIAPLRPRTNPANSADRVPIHLALTAATRQIGVATCQTTLPNEKLIRQRLQELPAPTEVSHE